MKKIPLTQGKFALVDDEDYKWLTQWKWCAQKCGRTYRAVRGYRKLNGTRGIIYMHRKIMKAEPGEEVDHINGDGWDNRKINMRLATHAQNTRNLRKRASVTSSQYKGVYWDKRYEKWHARVMLNGKHWHLGYFINERDAALAYDNTARELFGEFAKPNFPTMETIRC